MAKQKNDDQLTFKGETIFERSMDEVMHDSMLPYAEYVILERALPRVEDGLKPVQRRILYTMRELSLTPDKPHRKSARIVGDTLGKYHPHGDTSVYEAMVRMAQDFNMQRPLVDGHGNFGSVDGDSAAAMRYTEARMTPLAMELLRDIDEDTVKFSLNFDDTLKEPDILPGRFPNLLVNGSSGIAVGLATNIPPHNLAEAIDATIAFMDNPNISLADLMKILPCPDFPTGGYILDSGEIRLAYETGRGKIIMRAKAQVEQLKNGKSVIAVTELPYQVNKARLLEEILKVSQEKKVLFAGISDIRDESDRTGMRAVVEVKKDADAEKILQYLYKYTDLQCTFGINMVAIASGKPQQLSLHDILRYYVAHQEDVVTRRTQFRLDNALKRAHILDGLMIAVLNIDEVIALIRASQSPKTAKEALMKRFSLSEEQAQAILDLRLQRLTNLERIAIEREGAEVKQLIGELKSILASRDKLRRVIKKELGEIKQRYAIPRRTSLLSESAEIVVDENDLKVVDEALITVLPGARLRRAPKRPCNAAPGPEERPLCTIATETDKRIRLFTNKGAMLTLAVADIPETKIGGKPANIAALLPLEKDEDVVAGFDDSDAGKLFFYTRQGNVKCTVCAEYNARTKRIAALNLKEGDELLGVERQVSDTILVVTAGGMSIRFPVDSVPEMGRVSAGVKAIKLSDNDTVVFAAQIEDEGEILTISDRGYAKRSFVFDYEIQGRYGKGLRAFDFKKNGSNGTRVAAVFPVKMPFDFVVEQRHGTLTALNTEDIPIEARGGKGHIAVMAILDDVVVSAYKKAPAAANEEASAGK